MSAPLVPLTGPPAPQTAPAAATAAAGGAVRESVPLVVWCLLAFLVLNLFSGYSDLMGFPVPPDRLLLAATLGLLLLQPDRPRLVWRPVHAVMIALVLWTTWSALGAGTLQGPGMYALVDRICVPFLMFLVGPLVLTTPRRRELLLRVLVLMGGYLGLTGIFEMFGPSSLVWPRYIMDEQLGILFGRARGPFVSAEPNGMTMGIALFTALLLLPRARGGWRAACLLAVALTGLGVVLCLTRSIWLATVGAGLVVGWLVPAVRRRLPVVVAALVGLFALVLLLVPAAAEALSERFNMVSSVYDRQNTNAAALRIIDQHPLTGIGWHRFMDVGLDWIRQADTYPVTNVHIEVHDVFLSRAAETGIPGAALWVLAVLLGPVLGLRRLPARGEARTWCLLLVAALFYWLVPSLVSPNSYPLPNNLMWLIGGVASAPLLVRPTDTPPPEETHRAAA